MKFLTDFYKNEDGEIKLGAVVMFIIGVIILYIFWDEVIFYIKKVFEISNVKI